MQCSRGRASGRPFCRARAVALVGLSGLLTCGLFGGTLQVTTVAWLPRQPTELEVGLAGEWPGDDELRDVARWTVRQGSLRDASEVALRPERVEVERRLQVVTLFMRDALLPFDDSGDMHEVTVRYFKGDGFAEGRVLSLKQRQEYVAARGKGEADVFLSGAFTTGRGSKPTYSAEVKLRQRHVTQAGSDFSATFALSAANEPNIDPDSITAAVAYRPARRLLGSHVEWSVLSGEFARRTDVRNAASAARLIWTTRTLGRNTALQAAAEPFAGFEAGRNFTRADVSGDRVVLRPLLGANLYLLALQPVAWLNRITLGAEFTLRLPQTDEPYTQRRAGRALTSLSQRARPHLGASVAFQFVEGYGISIEYRHGSLPPAFERVEHRVALSLTVQRKRK